MEKSKFEKFIAKYNLGGSCESVMFKVDGQTLSTRAISDKKNVMCEVSAQSMGLEKGDYPVYETAKLRSLLGVLGEALTVSTKKVNDKFVALEFGDGNSDVTFVLADSTVIPNVPDLKKLPSFESIIDMDEQFITTFIKAQSALSDVETFMVSSNGTEAIAEVVLGFASTNTNRVKLRAKTTEVAELKPTNFSAKHLREILVANKEAKGGKLEISSMGFARTLFDVDGIKSTYYLVGETK